MGAHRHERAWKEGTRQGGTSGSRGGSWRRRIGLGLTGGVAIVWLAGSMFSSERQASAESLREGRELFVHEWVSTDAASSTYDPFVAENGDGLGPVFNAKSCAACHYQGGLGGAGLARQNVVAYDVVPTKTNPTFHSGVVHAAADDEKNHECTAEVSRLFPIVQGEQRRVGGCVVTIPDFDPVKITSINSPALFGAGTIDRIPESAIRGYQRQRQLATYPKEFRGDFSATPAGRARILPDGRIGRFGWKAQFATLEDFVASACAVELGLSNPRRKQDRPHLQGEDREAQLDMTAEQLFSLTAFTGSLPRPQKVLPEDAAERSLTHRGEALFSSIGCADCHTPNLGEVAGLYSDLLLHKLEDDRDGNRYARVDPETTLPDGQPLPNEWKTPPLWCVADTAPYFHDGASPTLESAILRHGMQGQRVKERFEALPTADRHAVILFLETLRAAVTEAAPTPTQRNELAAKVVERR